MTLEWRGDRPYFYTSTREGSKVIRKYIASGDLAIKKAFDADQLRWAAKVLDDLFEEADEAERIEEEYHLAEMAEIRAESEARDRALEAERRKQERDLRARLVADDAEAARDDEDVIAAGRCVLVAAGYRRHRRGEWRRVREGRTMATKKKTKTERADVAEEPKVDPAAADPGPEMARALSLADRYLAIEKLGETDMSEARRLAKVFVQTFLNGQFVDPEGRRSLMASVSPDGHTLDCQIKQIAGNSPFSIELMSANVEAMRASLEGPDSSPIEKLVVGRILAAWLRACQLDYSATRLDPGKTADLVSRMAARNEARFGKLVSTLHALRTKAPTPMLLALTQQVSVEVPRREIAEPRDNRDELADVLAGRSRAIAN